MKRPTSLYDDAVQLVTEMQTASVSMLQRRLELAIQGRRESSIRWKCAGSSGHLKEVNRVKCL